MNANGTAALAAELEQLSDDVLLKLIEDVPDPFREPERQAEYARVLEATLILQARGVIETQQQKQERVEQERKQRQKETKHQARKEQAEKRLREDDVRIPAWWFESGAIAKVHPSVFLAAATVVALLENNGDHIPLELIAEKSGLAERSARRNLNIAAEAGLIKKATKKVPGAKPPRSACFFSIPRTGGHP